MLSWEVVNEKDGLWYVYRIRDAASYLLGCMKSRSEAVRLVMNDAGYYDFTIKIVNKREHDNV